MLGIYPAELVQYSYYRFCRNTAIITFCVFSFIYFFSISLSTSTFDIPTADLLMFIFFIFSQEVNMWHLVPLLVKGHRFISIVFGFKRSSSRTFRVGIISIFWSTPKPHLSFPAMSFPEGSLKVISSPVSTHLLVRTGPIQTRVPQSLAQSDRASRGTSMKLWNDKLAITSTDTLQHRCDRRPAEIMTGFFFYSQLKWKTAPSLFWLGDVLRREVEH